MTPNINSEISEFNEALARRTNIILLCIHTALLIAFTIIWVPVMIIVNILSVAIYFAMFKVIPKNIVIYLIVTYAEVLIHMFLASICMGWECGFQLYCFAVIPIIYYCDYISKKFKTTKVYPIPMIVGVILCYFIIRTYSLHFSGVSTPISDSAAKVVYSINAFIVFMFLILYLYLYQNMGLTTELLLQRTAEYDVLTGLANRYKMNSIFEELTEEEAVSQNNFSVAILDIDDFKCVNDTYGHTIGDEVLKKVAEILKQSENDHIHTSRWGGEEFLVVVSGNNSYETAKALLEFIRVNVAGSSIESDDKKIQVTISSGIALHNIGESTVTTISRADSFLYKAKRSGKNKVIAEEV